jgi:hypothetical protein
MSVQFSHSFWSQAHFLYDSFVVLRSESGPDSKNYEQTKTFGLTTGLHIIFFEKWFSSHVHVGKL